MGNDRNGGNRARTALGDAFAQLDRRAATARGTGKAWSADLARTVVFVDSAASADGTGAGDRGTGTGEGRLARVHDTVREMLEVLGRVPEQPDSCVFALVEAADPEEPITVRGERGGCGGGKGRVVIDGRGRVEASALGSPTHLLVRCTAVQGSPVTVLVERGSRGIPTWPAGDLSESQIEFRSARTAAESVLTGTV